ncbi:invasin Asp14 [Anaplasma phagocytophilum]|uniref:Uncharacterized protein n=3 Tax=Anaplasma phagocytophilum TaxID=948 RepID=Q2GL86_ANAPZ|nr:invasin Asp14 [Anaplasma phagocytophilum]ABD44479.1 hypothetical protein APH_0248 [Anaplasma phagocytophilum str. HZ]AGR78679.1 hypothetical protein YYU_01195 [Anaplasma phagocytophilum str. HZ2]AGR79926.1 hypothetical protein WSQ_01185 [Anaplasma phagocytophilum str. JM]AGR81181.1 hypothetical protein YYY_01200 [Anaplasma phagocytophilum str. Dog2]EOA61828.1 hypothetical protein HGE1_01090 [Anaplasma phagocytophilum str. HGE1]
MIPLAPWKSISVVYMSGSDEYKEIIKQCIGSVKEVFGEGRFDDVVASIMKMQEKVLASSMQQDDTGTVGQIESGEGSGARLSDEQVQQLMNSIREEFKDDLRAIKRRILKLERAVYGANTPKES